MASANVKMLSDAEFQKAVLDSPVPVLLDFTATWCGPCKAISPILDQIADANVGKLAVYKLDIDDNMETPNKYGVQSIPTLLVFKDGQLVDRRVGAAPKPVIDQLVARVVS
ncbi:MAG: thioredoxin [Deltaproteobacteria bacterium]|nr:thioredoxin [Deltaproteobacteria bacterium]